MYRFKLLILYINEPIKKINGSLNEPIKNDIGSKPSYNHNKAYLGARSLSGLANRSEEKQI